MDYGGILSDTWKITWKYKVFWILGILAGCSSSGRGGSTQYSSGLGDWNFDSNDLNNFRFNIPELDKFFQNINEETVLLWLAGLACIALFVGLVLLVLGVIGQGGLIAGFGQADRGMDVTLGEAFSFGVQNFWKLLGIRLTVWIAGFVVAVLAGIAIIGIGIFTLGIGLICLLPLFCLLIPLFFGLDAYITLTMVAAVEEKLGVFDAFRRAWEIVREKFGQVLVMALILIVGGGIVGVILAAPFLAVGVPALVGMATNEGSAAITGISISAVLFICAFPFLLLLEGIVTTYITGAWTLTFRRLTGNPSSMIAAETA